MKDKENIRPVDLTDEDRMKILRGIRPDWMSKHTFKEARKSYQRAAKEYLKGRYVSVAGKPVKA